LTTSNFVLEFTLWEFGHRSFQSRSYDASGQHVGGIFILLRTKSSADTSKVMLYDGY